MKNGKPEKITSTSRPTENSKQSFYRRNVALSAGFSLDDRYRRKSLSFNGSETRILMYSYHARIFPGDKKSQFGAPDEYLALQMFPTSDFHIYFDNTKYSCNLASIAKNGEYRFSVSRADKSSQAIITLTGPRDTLRFDGSLGYAIVFRELHSSDGSLVMRYTFEDHVNVPGGGWLAKSIECQTTLDGEFLQKTSLVATELNFDKVSEQLFKLDFRPNTTISDMRHFPPNADGTTPIVNYVVPDDAGALRRTVQHAIAASGFQKTGAQ